MTLKDRKATIEVAFLPLLPHLIQRKLNLITNYYRHYILCVDYKNQSFTLRYS